MNKYTLPFPVGTRLHMLDSGAFSLINQARKKRKAGQGKVDWSIYKTDEFREYMDAYAEFIKKYRTAIDYYVNIDAIGNPEITWENQMYLEKEHGLKPIPVVHQGEPIKWVEKYLEAGYDYLAIGKIANQGPFDEWCDRCFEVICNQENRLPLVKVHGFAITRYTWMVRWPWYSVDSTTWIKMAFNGQILMPSINADGVFVFDKPYMRLFVDDVSPYTNRRHKANGPRKRLVLGQRETIRRHYQSMSPLERSKVRQWLKIIGVPIGKSRNGKVVTEGVTNNQAMREKANIHYYEHFCEVHTWPWAWDRPERQPTLFEVFGGSK